MSAGPRSPITKADRVMALFREQNVKCWVCGYPMLPFQGKAQRAPSRVAATLDHLVPPNTTGARRPAKAAHCMCNCARAHDPSIPDKELDKVRRLFGNREWIKMVFGNRDGIDGE